MDPGGDALVLEEPGERAPARRPHDEEVVDVPGAGPLGRQQERKPREPRHVARRQRAPVIVHGVQPPEQDAPHGGLDVVEAQVEADLRVDVLVEPAVVADPPAPRRHVVVVGDEEATVAHDREVLRGVEGEGAGAAEAADLASLPGRSVGLGAVLHEPEAALGAESLDGGEIGRMAVEVYRDEAHGARRGLDGRIPDVHGIGVVHVHEDGDGAREADGLHGGERRVRRHQHLVPALDAERLECHPERGGRAAREDRVLGAVVPGELLLEGAALRAQDVLARVDGSEDRPLDLVVDRGAGQRDRHQRTSPGE